MSGDFIVVGELQNDGNSILQSVTVNATAVDSNGAQIAGNSAMAYVSDLNVTEKAPFFIDIGQANAGGDNWGSTVSSVEFSVFNTISTTNTQYSGLANNIGFNGTLNGPYTVIGFVKNSGNQTANNVNVVGTFYNNLGTVVAVGFDKLNGSLAPGNLTSFTVSEYDGTSDLTAEISSYSILLQTTTLQGNNNDIPDGSTGPSSNTELYVLVALGMAAIIIIIVALIIYRIRKKAPYAMPAPSQLPPESPAIPPPPPP